MPSAASKKSKASQIAPPEEPESAIADDLPSIEISRPTKKKGRNASSNQIHLSEESVEAEVTEVDSAPVHRGRSILGQVPHAFERRRETLQALEGTTSPEKVSDHFQTRTEEWTEQIPFGKSPPGASRPGSSFSGSPPVAPGFVGRGGFSSKTPPVSPRQRQARPVSFGGGVPPLPAGRPLSAQYPYPPSTYGSPPAPPHLPQPHFYAATDVDLGLGLAARSAASVEITFAGLSQAFGFRKQPGHTTQIVLLGSEGRLDALSLQGTKTKPVGALYGLPGVVVNAQILTWESGPDPLAEARPLAVVILHGQKLPEENSYPLEQWEEDPPRSVANGPALQTGIQADTQYQTRVEIYSLSRRKRIATLLKMPPKAAEPRYGGKFYAPPEPTGSLKVATAGNYLSVASGSSGELFVFGVTQDSAFECLAKFWTTIQPYMQRRDSSHGRSSDADISPADLNRGSISESPLFSLSHRWLMFCPATNPSRPSLQAVFGSEIVQARLSGLNSSTAPARPSMLCDVDSPDADTIFGKVVRGVTQQAIKGAGWVFDQGIQAFNTYWRKDQPATASPRGAMSPPSLSPQPLVQQFPPTHSLDTQHLSIEADLVSIIDLKALESLPIRRHPELPKPVATFQPPGGCSYVSFSPNGLSLLTASRKGDLYYVWDLLQLKYHRLAAAVGEGGQYEVTSTAPRVRQVAKFPRYTTSTVVDVIWAPLSGERFAVVTKNGTIHLYDMPPSSMRWPPPRHIKKQRPTSAPVDRIDGDGLRKDSSTGLLASAMNLAGRTQPILANIRGRAPSFGGTVGGLGNTGIGLASVTGAKGGRALAAGFSKSLGAASGTVAHMRLAGESRISLKSLANDPADGRIIWTILNSQLTLVVLDKNAVRSYTVSQVVNPEQKGSPMSIFDNARKPSGSKLPSLTTLVSQNLAVHHLDSPQDDQVDDAELFPGYWARMPSNITAQTPRLTHPLSFAEIESNAPYQPFHSDPRVTLSIYAEGATLEESHYPTVSTILGSSEPASAPGEQPTPDASALRVFGLDVLTVRLNLQSYQHGEDDDPAGKSVIYRETTTAPVKTRANEAGVEQIVTTTRRRKANRLVGTVAEAEMGTDEEGFFEDDCDVLDFAEDRV